MRGGVIRAAAATALALAGVVAAAPQANAEPALLENEWWFKAWALDQVWNTSRGGGVTVAVLDTGVNAGIPDLSGVVLSGGDVTGNGTDGRTDTDTESKGHGTSMAALIAGQGNSQLLGVAPDARILPVLVNSPGQNDPVQTYPEGIRFAVDHGAQVINISQGGTGSVYPNNCPPEVQDAISYAVEHDAVVVASTGNDGAGANMPNFPAACAGVLAVGAVDNQRNPWSNTQRQDYVEVAGPGVDIVSVSSSGTATIGSGTSPATALVSGAVALVRSAHPDMPARQIVARILATARDSGPPGKDNTTGVGVVRPMQAITESVPADAPNPIFDELEQVTPAEPTGGATPAPEGSDAPPADGDQGGTASDESDSGGFPVAYVLVAALAVVAFVGTTLMRRRRVRPAGGPGPVPGAAPWPGGPPPPGPPQGPPPQQWPPSQPGGPG